jgi:short-subunit dehydrogenase
MTRRRPLEGRVAFITGASSGIGAALAREFVARGVKVALAARRADRLHALAAELGDADDLALGLVCDVTRAGDLERSVNSTREAFGRIDIVVANAGFAVRGRLDTLTLEDYRRQFETNVLGVLRTVVASLDDLKRSRGCLLLMGSVSSYIALPADSAYAMSKFAVRALADALRYELAAHQIGVTLVCPGFVESEIYEIDNQGIRRPGTPRRVPGCLVMPTDRAARQMIDALARRRSEIVVTGPGRLAVLLQRHAPRLVSWALRLGSQWSTPRSPLYFGGSGRGGQSSRNDP